MQERKVNHIGLILNPSFLKRTQPESVLDLFDSGKRP